MAIVRAAVTVGGFTMISRVTGFVRDILIAAILGAGPLTDAFLVAFRIPNLFRSMTGEGAFSAAFVPMFATMMANDSKAVALRFAEEAFAFLAAVLLVFTVTAVLFMPQIMTVLAPGFTARPEVFDLAVALTRITFIYLPFISLVALLGGILNSLNRFAAMASAPILLNLILILSLSLFSQALDTPSHVLAWGVAAAGLAQFLWLLEACRRCCVLPRLRLPRWTRSIRRLGCLMLPGVFGAAVLQINLLIDMVLASTLPTGSISFLYYADRVNQLPLGVVGIAIGTALLPTLSRQIGASDAEGAENSQDRAVHLGLLLALPAATGLMVLAEPIITVLFQRGAFDSAAATMTAWALVAYGAGLPAFVLIKVLQPGFFARRDTATPVKVAACIVGLNLALNLILMQFFAHVGLAMATSIAAWTNMAVLALLLRRRGFYAIGVVLRGRLLRIIPPTALMAGGLFAGSALLRPWLGGPTVQAVAVLFVLVVGGVAVFAAAALWFRAIRLDDVQRALRRSTTT